MIDNHKLNTVINEQNYKTIITIRSRTINKITPQAPQTSQYTLKVYYYNYYTLYINGRFTVNTSSIDMFSLM